MDMPEDTHAPIILGRACLATTRVVFDVKRGKLTLDVGVEKVVFELQKVMASTSTEIYKSVHELKEWPFEVGDHVVCTKEKQNGNQLSSKVETMLMCLEGPTRALLVSLDVNLVICIGLTTINIAL